MTSQKTIFKIIPLDKRVFVFVYKINRIGLQSDWLLMGKSEEFFEEGLFAMSYNTNRIKIQMGQQLLNDNLCLENFKKKHTNIYKTNKIQSCTNLAYIFKALKEAFKIFDKNRNGYIEAKELRAVTTTLGQTLSDEEFNEFWREADRNHDGKLDYEEFIKMMLQY